MENRSDIIDYSTMYQTCFLKNILSSYKSLSAFYNFLISLSSLFLPLRHHEFDIFIEQNLGPHIEQNGPLLPLQLEVFHHEIL
jgi:hypothetical protein